jgi:site-specific DNA-methyltransferase (adenine-specific)
MKFFEDDRFKLLKGDCLMLLLKMKENSVDMIFADPPYNLSQGSFSCQNGKMVSVKKGDWDMSKGIENDFAFHNLWIKECKRVLKPNGSIWISGTYHSIYQCGFSLQSNGYHILNDVAWLKPNAAPNLSCRFFTASHETLIWARKSKEAKHTFNYQEMKNGEWHEKDIIKKEGKQMRSVWSIGTTKPIEKINGKHPTQKPEDLLKRIILASTNKGDLILDPFNGSGTTGIVANLFNRRYIGIEQEQEYLNLTKRRYKYLRENIKNKIEQKKELITK